MPADEQVPNGIHCQESRRQEASAYELAALGNFLARNGMHREALAYYEIALRLEDSDPVLWVNVGTLHRQSGEISSATNAYGRALSIDPNNALAHYNLGAVLDATGKYEDAIAAYKLALTLDPSLGDPTANPRARRETVTPNGSRTPWI